MPEKNSEYGALDVKIDHRYAERVFIARVEGWTAELSYERSGSIIRIISTYVPQGLRGRGVAELLCDAAFRYAEANEYKIVPVCSYVRDTYLKRNPAELKFASEK